MGVHGNLYQVIKVLHILAAIIGFGGMFIAGFYGQEAKNRPGREGLAIGETTLKVTSLVPTMAVYSVPVLGLLLIFFSKDTWKFSQTWISLSMLLYIVLIVLAVVVQVPAIRRMVALQGEGSAASPAEVEALNKKLAVVSGIVNVLWIVTLFLMVFKPGAPAGA